MTLPLPDIDNVDFEELVEQARLAIPRYASGWTDHNVHDPGIMLIELAAWLVDQQIYTSGFVSDKHLAAFASLLGVSARAAQPALGLIWPDANALASDPAVIGTNLPAGALAITRQQPDVVFRTLFDTHLTPARPLTPASATAQVAGGSGREQSFVLSFDRPLVETAAGGALPITIGVELDDESVTTIISGAEGRIAIDYRLAESASSRALDAWQRLEIVTDTTVALNQSGVVRVRVPSTNLVSSVPEKRHSQLRLRLRYRINPVGPAIRRIGVNALAVEQREFIGEALLGTADGRPGQTFPIDLGGTDPQHPPRIEVVENTVFVPWRRVDSLTDTGPDDPVYVLDTIAARLLFGNGVNGRLPAQGAQVRHRGYTVTRGASGNLTANLDWRVTGVALSVGASRFGSNLRAMTGGEDAWDANRLRAAARQRSLARRAFVTNNDLAAAADQLRTIGVQETNVLVGFDPLRPFAVVPNSRTLLVTPRARPMVTERQYLSAVSDVVAPGRVIGERLHVAIKAEQVVDIDATILIMDGVNPAPVREAVHVALQRRLSRTRVSDDVEPWPPGRTLERGEIETLISRVDGVVSVLSCEFGRTGSMPSGEPIFIEPDAVAVLGALRLIHRTEPGRGGEL